jgi:hypothetical protein
MWSGDFRSALGLFGRRWWAMVVRFGLVYAGGLTVIMWITHLIFFDRPAWFD